MFFKNKLFSKSANGSAAQSEPTVIARNMTIEGNLISDGEVHIDGTVIGSIKAAVCVVEATGSVTGEINADVLYAHGAITGPINAGHVRIYSGSQIKGDVYNETISIEDGAYLHGSVRHGRQGFSTAPNQSNAALNPFESLIPNNDQFGAQNPTDDYRPIRAVRTRG